MRFYNDIPHAIANVPRIGEALAGEMAKLGVAWPIAELSRHFGVPEHVVRFVTRDVYRANETRSIIEKGLVPVDGAISLGDADR